MTPRPPIPPVVDTVERVRFGRDYCVGVASNDYSVDPRFIGRFVDIAADLDHVQITCEGHPAETHPRCWATGRTITDSEHVRTAQELRVSF